MSQTDLIVVGAGSAGCVLASRLAREHGLVVTLVEPPSTPAPAVDRQRPSRWLKLLGSSDDWNLQTEPIKALSGRRLRWPRGRGLGGSSRINAMIWFPPTRRDLAMLADASGGQWTTRQLTAAYQAVAALAEPCQPVWISEASRRFMGAVSDMAGATPMVYQRVTRQGRRWNPAGLLQVQDRAGSQINVVRAQVDQLIFRGDRAIGVRLVDKISTSDMIAAEGVVLCAGAVATPTILMRSGIGPRDQLNRHRIDVRCEHHCIGENLQDHLIMPVVFQTRSPSIFNMEASMRDIARWQVLGTGPVGSNIAECGGLFAGDAIQIHVTPTHYLTFPKPAASPAMTIGVQVTQPASRGSITLGSSHVGQPPRIDAGYLSRASDLRGTIQGVRLARDLARRTGLAEWVSAELLPSGKRQDDASIAKSIARYAQTLYHPVGTCPVGSNSDMAVDSGFALRGTRALWIADASVLPKLTVGNPNATIMTLASMAADLVMDQIQRE